MLNFYFITGFMGTGKTSILRMLHEKITQSLHTVFSTSLPSQENSQIHSQQCWLVEDLDIYIEKKFEMSVSAYFEQFGEIKFRRTEQECLQDIFEKASSLQNIHLYTDVHVLISLGGGCIFDRQTRNTILNFVQQTDTSICFNLSADFHIIQQRIQGEELLKRPLANNQLQQKYMERKRLWSSISKEIRMSSIHIEDIPNNNLHWAPKVDLALSKIVSLILPVHSTEKPAKKNRLHQMNCEVEIW